VVFLGFTLAFLTLVLLLVNTSATVKRPAKKAKQTRDLQETQEDTEPEGEGQPLANRATKLD
jgi:hypothetical protein